MLACMLCVCGLVWEGRLLSLHAFKHSHREKQQGQQQHFEKKQRKAAADLRKQREREIVLLLVLLEINNLFASFVFHLFILVLFRLIFD